MARRNLTIDDVSTAGEREESGNMPNDGTASNATAQTMPEGVPVADRASEGERAAFLGRVCERCGKPLKGRKERFCSDACRMRVLRAVQRARFERRFKAIFTALHDLKREVLR